MSHLGKGSYLLLVRIIVLDSSHIGKLAKIWKTFTNLMILVVSYIVSTCIFFSIEVDFYTFRVNSTYFIRS